MNSDSQQWNCSKGSVDRQSDHFEIRYGDASNAGPDQWLSVALVGRSADGTLNVEFLIDRSDPENSATVKAVEKELNFYIVEKRERHPWNYMQYHCGTPANLYSNVHWSFHPTRSPKQP